MSFNLRGRASLEDQYDKKYAPLHVGESIRDRARAGIRELDQVLNIVNGDSDYVEIASNAVIDDNLGALQALDTSVDELNEAAEWAMQRISNRIKACDEQNAEEKRQMDELEAAFNALSRNQTHSLITLNAQLSEENKQLRDADKENSLKLQALSHIEKEVNTATTVAQLSPDIQLIIGEMKQLKAQRENQESKDREQIIELQSKVSLAETNFTLIKDQNDTLRMELTNERQDTVNHTKLQPTVDRLRRERNEAQRQLKDAESKISTLTAEAARHSTAQAELSNQRDTYSAYNRVLQDQLSQSNKNIQNFAYEKIEIQQRRDQAIEEQARLKETVTGHLDTIRQGEADKISLRNDLDTVKRDLENAKAADTTHVKTMSQLYKEVATERLGKESLSRKVANLEGQVKEVTDQRDSVTGDRDKIMQEYEQLKSRQPTASDHNDQFLLRLEATQLRASKDQLKENLVRMSVTHKDEVNTLSGQLAEITSQKDIAQSRVAELQTQLTTSEGDLQETNRQLTEMQKRHTDGQAKLKILGEEKASSEDRLKEETASLGQRIGVLRNEVDKHVGTIDVCNQKVENLREEQDRLVQDKARLETENSDMRSRHTIDLEKIANLQRDLDTARTEADSQAAQAADSARDVKQYESRIRALSTWKTSAEQTLRDSQQKVEHWRKTDLALVEANGQLREDIAQKVAELQSIKELYNDANKKVEALSDVETIKNQLIKEVEMLQEALAEKTQCVESLKSRLTGNSTALEEMQAIIQWSHEESQKRIRQYRVADDEMTSLQSRVQRLTLERDQLDTKYMEMKGIHRANVDRLEQAESQNSRLDKKLTSANAKLSDATKKCESLKARVTRLEEVSDRCTNLEHLSEQLDGQLDAMQSRAHKAEQEAALLNIENAKLKANLERANDAKAHAERTSRNMSFAYNQHAFCAESLSDVRITARTERNVLKKQVDDLEIENATLQENLGFWLNNSQRMFNKCIGAGDLGSPASREAHHDLATRSDGNSTAQSRGADLSGTDDVDMIGDDVASHVSEDLLGSTNTGLSGPPAPVQRTGPAPAQRHEAFNMMDSGSGLNPVRSGFAPQMTPPRPEKHQYPLQTPNPVPVTMDKAEGTSQGFGRGIGPYRPSRIPIPNDDLSGVATRNPAQRIMGPPPLPSGPRGRLNPDMKVTVPQYQAPWQERGSANDLSQHMEWEAHAEELHGPRAHPQIPGMMAPPNVMPSVENADHAGKAVGNSRESSVDSNSSLNSTMARVYAASAFEFLIQGTPQEGQRTSDVHHTLLARVEASIRNWTSRAKKGAWARPAKTLRCVENRVCKLNATAAPRHGDDEHRTACPRCTKMCLPCVMIVDNKLPVVLPLANPQSGMTPYDFGYYIGKRSDQCT